MARILRIDPRASVTDGAPILSVVVDLTQSKRISDVTADCAGLTGNALFDCQAKALEQTRALFTPFPYPEKNANLLITVDGAAQPATFVSKARWGEQLNSPDVGTAWLLTIDCSSSMGNRFAEAKALATAFINSMTANDIVDIVPFTDHQVLRDSGWIPASKRSDAAAFVSRLSTYPAGGRTRPLATFIRTAVTDAFNNLGNVGSSINVPMHQAMVVLSNGQAGGDPSSTGPGALTLQQYLTKGRFPEDNTALPKTPVPVISIWFPPSQWVEELMQSSQEFMLNLANTEIGGFYTIVRQGDAARAGRIVAAVRERFNNMHIVKYRVSCIAPNVQQTFQLVFSNVKPMIAGDASFKDVPVGIDPTTWPLDINYQYTMDRAKSRPVAPGESFKIYGNFCWGGEKSRAEVYFLPKDQAAPPSIQGGDIQTAKRAQQQLIAMNMRGKTLEASDTFVEFEAPDSEKILLGKGDSMQVRLVVYDNNAKRTSAVDAKNILTLKGSPAPFPWLLVGGGAAGFVVLVLLVLAVVRAGGSKRGRGAGSPPPAPVVAMGPQPYPGAGGYGAPPAGPAAAPYGAPQAQPYGAAPVAQPYSAPAQPAPQPAAGDFMYGGKPAQYGLTGAQPAHGAPPPDPYAVPGAAPAGGASRAVLSGSAGTFYAAAGSDLVVGRDASRCQIVLQEPRVSAVHAVVHFDGAQVYVRDDGSNNGTFVNGNRLGPGMMTPVPPGSVLRFGPVEFVVRLE